MVAPKIEDNSPKNSDDEFRSFIVTLAFLITVPVQLLAVTVSVLIIINAASDNDNIFALIFVPFLIFSVKICYSIQGNVLGISKKSKVDAEKIRGRLWLIIFICTIGGIGLAVFVLWVLALSFGGRGGG